MYENVNITRADMRPPPRGVRRRPNDLYPHALPQGLFVAELIGRQLIYVNQTSFRGTSPAARLSELTAPVLIRSDLNDDNVEAFVRIGRDAIALVDAGHNCVDVEVAAVTAAAALHGVQYLREHLEAKPTEPQRVSVAFWMRAERGGEARHRQIDAPAFDEIATNYAAPVRDALATLIATNNPGRGGLILWRGDPGTGKSHALRALARSWAPWCSAHFIMDPDELLSCGGAYILDVLTWDDGDDSKWRLLILEDAGELIAADARATTGQALSRLLNVADGMLGQGTRTLLLITTNEPVKRLHPATRRPGRCLADIEFTALSTDEANAWLADHGHERRVTRPSTLAELFGHDSGGPLESGAHERQFGFAQALHG